MKKPLLITFLLISVFTRNSVAQSKGFQNDMLQGQWFFKKLETNINFDMEAKTKPYNPYNIHFTFKKNTCTVIRLISIGPCCNYDTTRYLFKLDSNVLSFFSISKQRKKRPLFQLKLGYIQNQTLVIEDFEAENINESLFLRNAKFTYYFTRYNSLGGSPNLRNQLNGRWYSKQDFISQLYSSDTIELFLEPIPVFDLSIKFLERSRDTVYIAYKQIDISDEDIECYDSLVAYKKIQDYEVIDLGAQVLDKSINAYYIFPEKKQLQIMVSEMKRSEKEYLIVERYFLFSYFKYKGHLVLIPIKG